jgi:hypothetical protein
VKSIESFAIHFSVIFYVRFNHCEVSWCVFCALCDLHFVQKC